MATFENWITAAADWIWGLPLLLLVTGGGFLFLATSGFLPFRHLRHAIDLVRGRHDDPDAPGEITHYQALSIALAATVGMGNVAGVAVAIQAGGPGVVFWMWVSAIVGMATKYFTCTLAVLFRGRDAEGRLQGGPMYVIVEGLGKRWRPLAVFFCLAGMVGCLPVFNVNQLTQAIGEIVLVPAGIEVGFGSRAGIGVVLAVATAAVIFGGLSRISAVACRIVPFMVVVYFFAVGGIVVMYAGEVPGYLARIVTDAFTANSYGGDPLLGSALGGLIVLGARRASFSNEAGIGTAPMAHGAARAEHPVQEGLVAMLGPVIDTLLVCTLTALAILVTGVWETSDADGVGLTATAFESAYPGWGPYLLLMCIVSFSVSSLFSYSYFGGKCLAFLLGPRRRRIYDGIYVASIIVGATSSMAAILNLIDFSFALMAIPTVVSAALLAGRVKTATREYFANR